MFHSKAIGKTVQRRNGSIIINLRPWWIRLFYFATTVFLLYQEHKFLTGLKFGYLTITPSKPAEWIALLLPLPFFVHVFETKKFTLWPDRDLYESVSRSLFQTWRVSDSLQDVSHIQVSLESYREYAWWFAITLVSESENWKIDLETIPLPLFAKPSDFDDDLNLAKKRANGWADELLLPVELDQKLERQISTGKLFKT